MRELKINEAGQKLDRFTGKVLTCDVCDREDGAKSDWEGHISVDEWGNEHDFGTICDECHEDQLDEL